MGLAYGTRTASVIHVHRSLFLHALAVSHYSHADAFVRSLHSHFLCYPIMHKEDIKLIAYSVCSLSLKEIVLFSLKMISHAAVSHATVSHARDMDLRFGLRSVSQSSANISSNTRQFPMLILSLQLAASWATTTKSAASNCETTYLAFNLAPEAVTLNIILQHPPVEGPYCGFCPERLAQEIST
jgi:hypothetical protein